MERRFFFVLIFVFALVAQVLGRPAKDLKQGPVAFTGEEAAATNILRRTPGQVLDEGGTPNSTYAIVGTTWYDLQTNGTAGKSIAVDAAGNAHIVWTNGENQGSGTRHVFYSCWDAAGDSLLFDDGERVDNGTRGGFCNVAATRDSFGFPAFHSILVTRAHASAAIDLTPRAGAFSSVEVPFPSAEPEIIWPHIDMDPQGRIHMVATENEGASAEYYVRGVPSYQDGFGVNIDFGAGFVTPWEPATFITIDVACSRTSNRVAVAWIQDPTDPAGFVDDENIMLKISEDGGENWGETINVTNIPMVDTSCVTQGGDFNICNGDTFRPWIDLSIILDDNDNVHIAYTCQASYIFDETGYAPAGLVYATLWHWGEDQQVFSSINQAFFANDSVPLGVNNLMCHRPSLAIDTTTGYLYCSFQQFDQHAYSDAGYPIGEFYLTVSTDNGRSWAVPTNVSNTPGEPNMPTGDDPSERDITIAKYVSNGLIHALYLHDYAAGSAVAATTPEGPATLNDMIYMRIPVTDIPTSPLLESWAFHTDSSGFPGIIIDDAGDAPGSIPAEFTLYQNYPNPFNPTTNIQFDLARAGVVELVVFDVTGREVATLVDNVQMNAGVHTLSFDGANLASGVYLARLEMGGASMTRKMVLLK